MNCANCVYWYYDDYEGFNCCHWVSTYSGDYNPCEEEEKEVYNYEEN